MEGFRRVKTSIKLSIQRLAARATQDLTDEWINDYLNRLPTLSQKLEENFDDILKTCAQDEIEHEQVEFEDLQDQLAAIKMSLSRQLALSTTQPPPIQQQSSGASTPSVDIASSIKAPRMELPQFSGDPAKWPSFSVLFKDAVENQNLPETIKFHLLLQSLKGQASSIVSFLPLSDGAFDEAWTLLKKKYENKKDIGFQLVKKVMDLPFCSTPKQLELLVDTTREVIRGLSIIGFQQDESTAVWIYPILDSKTDTETRFAWEQTLKGDKLSPLENYLDFLQAWSKNRQRTCQPSSQGKPKSDPPSRPSSQKRCPDCRLDHHLSRCPAFLKATIDERWSSVKKLRVCVNCLHYGHAHSQCRSQVRCRQCNKQHNSLLHNNPAPQHVTASAVSRDYVILATALVRIPDSSGKDLTFRALLDGGSQISLLTKEARKKLNLPVIDTSTKITTACGGEKTTSKAIRCQIKSIVSTYSMPCKLNLVDNIVTNLPTQPLPKRVLSSLLKDKELADPTYADPQPVDMLLGADVYAKILEDKITHQNDVVAQKTKFGWVIFGSLPALPKVSPKSVVAFTVTPNISRFWEIEDLPVKRFLTPEEEYTENFTTQHMRRGDDSENSTKRGPS